MKRILHAALAALFVAGTAFAAAETVSVVVRKASVRRDRQFYAPALAEAELGASFDVLAREKGWVKVATKSGEGWLHESAVTARQVSASSRGTAKGAAADDRDIAAAGKGFTPQVEKEYRKSNPSANYAAVDRLEEIGAGDEAVASFAREGNLQPRGAAK